MIQGMITRYNMYNHGWRFTGKLDVALAVCYTQFVLRECPGFALDTLFAIGRYFMAISPRIQGRRWMHCLGL